MRIKWSERASAASNAKRELPRLVAAYFHDTRALLAGSPAPKELHTLRLETKKLRYTLELFRGCYGPGFETRLNQLREVQRALGDLRDSVSSRKLLADSMKHSTQRSQILQQLDERASKELEHFLQFWREKFDAPGQENWWTGYLGRSTRRPGRR